MNKHNYIYNYDLITKAEKKTFQKINSFEVMQMAAKVNLTGTVLHGN